jgi:hypothetical protein
MTWGASISCNDGKQFKQKIDRGQIMSFTFGLLMVVSGLGVMAFGLFLFYAWLPVLYALVGLDIGLLLGRSLTGDVGTTAWILGIVCAVVLGAASYWLEPYRRILLGVSIGLLLGFSLSAVLGFDGSFGGLFGWVLAIACGVIGGFLVPIFFNAFVIAMSSVTGAAMVMIGARHLLPGVSIFDHSQGGVMPTLLMLVLALIGIGWQRRNIDKWVQMLPAGSGVPDPKDQAGHSRH